MCDGAFVAAPILLSSASAGGGRSLKRGRPRNAARVRIKSMVGYVPSEDDRPEGVPKVPTELTLSQQLLLRQYEEQIERMSARECQDLALEVARQMMVKDNILRTMLKKDIPFNVEPPDPREFLEKKEGDQ